MFVVYVCGKLKSIHERAFSLLKKKNTDKRWSFLGHNRYYLTSQFPTRKALEKTQPVILVSLQMCFRPHFSCLPISKVPVTMIYVLRRQPLQLEAL